MPGTGRSRVLVGSGLPAPCAHLREAIEDVSGVNNGGAMLFRLALEEVEKVSPGDDVQIRGHLVEEQHFDGAQELQKELDTAPLAVGHLVHAPFEVDAEQVDEHLPALRVSALHRQHHLADLHVSLESAPARNNGKHHTSPHKRAAGLVWRKRSCCCKVTSSPLGAAALHFQPGHTHGGQGGSLHCQFRGVHAREGDADDRAAARATSHDGTLRTRQRSHP